MEHCQCRACKRGVKIAKRLPKGKDDQRKWGVTNEGDLVAKMWYKTTATELARLLNKTRDGSHKAVALKAGASATVKAKSTVPQGEQP